LFASLKIAEIASNKENFASYIDTLPRYEVSPEIFIPCSDDTKFEIILKLQKFLRSKKYDFVDIDGARINFPYGWALCRASNTTPTIKCKFEADTKKHLIEIEKESLEIFKKIGVPVTEKTYKELSLHI